ncbi:MAG: hypothetical protein QJR03_11470 [Sphaerobacter sp.]|nr:hypothetical protein [Sphaerobacter sp.]
MAALAAGRPDRLPTREQARQIALSPRDRQRAQPLLHNIIVGDAATVARRVRAVAAAAQADEVMLTTFLPNQADRLRTVEQLARAWGLPRAGPAAIRRHLLPPDEGWC